MNLDPEPQEMSESNYEKFGFGAMVKRLPLSNLNPLLSDLNDALVENSGKEYNPKGLTVNNFTWANVNYGATQQLCAHSSITGMALASDVNLVPLPDGKFQGYMLELTKLSSFGG